MLTPTKVLTAGEAMMTFVTETLGPLRLGTAMTTGLAGAEFNVATTIASLGGECEWVGVVGEDIAGHMIMERLKATGVDSTHVRRVAVPTGLLVRERRSSVGSSVHYWRRGSAGSTLSPADVDSLPLTPTTIVHLTGITPALSPTAAAAVRLLHQKARDVGALVSLDVNYRAKLWSREEARAILRPLLHDSLVFSTVEESAILAGLDEIDADPAEKAALAAERLRQLGAHSVIVKLGREGAFSLRPDGSTLRASAPRVLEVDSVGAGDAFVGGYLTALMDGLDHRTALKRAVMAGAWSATTLGDCEVPPSGRDLERLVGEGEER